MTLPVTLEGSPDSNGNGIVVLDAKNYNFVKRIPPWNVPASRNPEQVSGVTGNPGHADDLSSNPAASGPGTSPRKR